MSENTDLEAQLLSNQIGDYLCDHICVLEQYWIDLDQSTEKMIANNDNFNNLLNMNILLNNIKLFFESTMKTRIKNKYGFDTSQANDCFEVAIQNSKLQSMNFFERAVHRFFKKEFNAFADFDDWIDTNVKLGINVLNSINQIESIISDCISFPLSSGHQEKVYQEKIFLPILQDMSKLLVSVMGMPYPEIERRRKIALLQRKIFIKCCMMTLIYGESRDEKIDTQTIHQQANLIDSHTFNELTKNINTNVYFFRPREPERKRRAIIATKLEEYNRQYGICIACLRCETNDSSPICELHCIE